MVGIAKDLNAVSRILNHPKVFAMLTDDGSPSVFIPSKNELYIINEAENGVVRLDPLNSVCCIAHIAALPDLWGWADAFAVSAIEWGFNNTRYSKVVALVPAFNRLTVRLCKSCGFQKEGVLKKSFMKKWRYRDQIVFGLTKTDFYKGETPCQQQ